MNILRRRKYALLCPFRASVFVCNVLPGRPYLNRLIHTKCANFEINCVQQLEISGPPCEKSWSCLQYVLNKSDILAVWFWFQRSTMLPSYQRNVGPTLGQRRNLRWRNVSKWRWICPSVQRWHNVVTPPTMTLCQRFANVITYCILLYLMVGTTFAHCLFL